VDFLITNQSGKILPNNWPSKGTLWAISGNVLHSLYTYVQKNEIYVDVHMRIDTGTPLPENNTD
jgi:hypothetical protein